MDHWALVMQAGVSLTATPASLMATKLLPWGFRKKQVELLKGEGQCLLTVLSLPGPPQTD